MQGDSAVLRVVADLGNSRLKWGRVDAGGRLAESIALPLDDRAAWTSAWLRWNPAREGSAWTISSVNPPVAATLSAFLSDINVVKTRWFRSGHDVPVNHVLQHVETAGADRALAVLAAVAMHPGQAGHVVSCGSAITVERISPEGVWQGGAIAPGLELSARALHLLTAQLPLVIPRVPPAAWGRSTRPALEAGVFWGVVGAVREILTRQSVDFPPAPWRIWTGGGAHLLAAEVDGENSLVVPDLVLEGLARLVNGQ